MKKNHKIKIFISCVLISFVIGAMFYKVVYAPDAYTIMADGISSYNDNTVFANMRPLQYLITKMFVCFLGENVRYEVIYLIYLTLSLIFIAISMYLVYTYILKLIEENDNLEKLTKFKKVLIFSCIVFMFFNKYIADNLIYLENLTMILSLFLAIIASIIYSKNIKFKNIICLVLLIISEFSYQTMITAFVLYSLIFYTLKENKKIDFKFLVKVTILFLVPLLLLYGFSKLNINGIIPNDRYAKGNEIFIVVSNTLLQVLIYSMVYLVLYLFLDIIFKRKNINSSNYLRNNIIYIIFLTVIYTYSFALINGAHLSYRMAFCIGALPSIICMFIILVSNYKIRSIVLVTICMLFNLLIYYNLYFVYSDYNNRIEDNAMYVVNYIDNFNKTHNEKIEKVVIYDDKNVTKSKFYSVVPYLFYRIIDNVYNVGDILGSHIKIYSNFRFTLGEKEDEIYEKYFYDKDWNEYDESQFVVLGDTLHYCRY